MSEDAFLQMVADKKLERQISECTTPEQLRQLLHDSVEKSGIAARDEISGQYVRRDPLAPVTNQDADAEPEQITRTEKIGGREITFSGTPNWRSSSRSSPPTRGLTLRKRLHRRSGKRGRHTSNHKPTGRERLSTEPNWISTFGGGNCQLLSISKPRTQSGITWPKRIRR